MDTKSPPAPNNGGPCEGRAAGPLDSFLKRGFDALASFFGLVVLCPILLVCAAMVRLSSPGPVFYRARRVGRGGGEFTLYKFRSMRVNGGGPAVTAGGDPRVTRVGAFLRKYKLDELPQLWNVLNGTMSLVGPRPEAPNYVAQYRPEWREALTVRPGITGAAQIEFRDEEELLAGVEDVERFYVEQVLPKKLAIDLRYVRTRTFLGDLALIFRTFGKL